MNTDKKSPSELSLSIANYLKRYIRQNKLKPHDKLPSENTLAALFSVNRNVVRSALATLRAQGLVYSEKGRGFFVAEKQKPILFHHNNGMGFSEILNQGHRNYETCILDVKKVLAGPLERNALDLDQDDYVYRLKVLRSIDFKPFAVCYSILPEKYVPDFDLHLENFRSVNEVLMNTYEYSHPICRKVSIEAALPVNEEIELLQITEAMPILKQISVFAIEGVGPIEYFIVRARGDRFNFSMSFE